MFVRKTLLLWLCALFLLLPLPGCGAEEVVSTTESGFTTRFNPNTGTLTVSGEGTLKDLYPRVRANEYEWEQLEKDYTVKKVVLHKGITKLDNCFNGLMALETISFPSTLKKIYGSFNYCGTIKKLVVPKTIKTIGEGSFNYCSNLSDIRFKGNIKLCHSGSFAGLDSLEDIAIPDNSVLCGAFYACNRLRRITLGANLECHESMAEEGWPCFMNFISTRDGAYNDRVIYMCEAGYTEEQRILIYDNIGGIGTNCIPEDQSTIITVKE